MNLHMYVCVQDWGYMVLLYLMVNLSRALATVIFYPSLSRGAYGIDWKQGIVLSWAGLRGAVSESLFLYSCLKAAPCYHRDRVWALPCLLPRLLSPPICSCPPPPPLSSPLTPLCLCAISSCVACQA